MSSDPATSIVLSFFDRQRLTLIGLHVGSSIMSRSVHRAQIRASQADLCVEGFYIIPCQPPKRAVCKVLQPSTSALTRTKRVRASGTEPATLQPSCMPYDTGYPRATEVLCISPCLGAAMRALCSCVTDPSVARIPEAKLKRKIRTWHDGIYG